MGNKRKTQYLQNKKEKKERRLELEKKIKEGGIKGKVAELLESSAKLGQKDTLKETLKKDLIRESLGMPSKRLWRDLPVEEPSKRQKLEDPTEDFFQISSNQSRLEELSLIKDQSSNTGHLPHSNHPISERSVTLQTDSIPKPIPKKPARTRFSLSTNAENKEEILKNDIRAVNRSNKIQEFRLTLPIINYEQEIMESISQNSITIICGETGSGKSTQIPQFLYEAGYKLIGITQPRRIAAISLASRVSEEMGFSLGSEIGYQVRYNRKFNKENQCIKYMTDGVLLKEISSEFLLSKYEVIVIDEAHERSVNTDILIGLLSRIVNLRKDLKLVIMSATLCIEHFTENPRLFKSPPPVIHIPTRMFPVSVHFNKRTSENYLQDSIKKTLKIHKDLPAGGILVFLPGKKDVIEASETLKSAIGKDSKVFQMYSLLSSKKQSKIFTYNSEKRLIVVSTNVAETSLTIPNIKYIVDCGLEKRKVFTQSLQIAKHEVTWISKASAEQRSGRAGRTCPGHCYRLYSNAAFSLHFADFRPPPILNMPLSHIVLELKSIGIENVHAFPFPTPPSPETLDEAINELIELGALKNNEATEIGREMAKIPLTPRYAKMLVLAHKANLQVFLAVIVAALEIENFFVMDELKKDKKLHSKWFTGKSDVLCPLKAMTEYYKSTDKEEFCRENKINLKSIQELCDLKRQILTLIGCPDSEILKYPKKYENTILKIVVSGFIDHIACKLDKTHKRIPYLTEKPIEKEIFPIDYPDNRDYAYIHPSSYLFSQSPPQFIAYQHMVFTKRPSFINNTFVEPAWLYEIGSNLNDFTVLPTPEYDESSDCIRAYISCSFGRMKWPLPAYRSTLFTEDVYHWFLKLLLSGKIIPQFAEVKWNIKLASITNFSATKTMKKISEVVLFLKDNDIRSRGTLMPHLDRLIDLLQGLVREEFRDKLLSLFN